MSKLLRMPTLAVLPEGPVRVFVELLFDYHYIAGHPTLEMICNRIDELPEETRTGTASRETIRRMLHGHVPRNWQTVEVVFIALCQLAGVDPDKKVDYYDREYDQKVTTDRRTQIRETWSAALYGRPVGKALFQGVDFDYEEPASASGFGAYNDDPPF